MYCALLEGRDGSGRFGRALTRPRNARSEILAILLRGPGQDHHLASSGGVQAWCHGFCAVVLSGADPAQFAGLRFEIMQGSTGSNSE